MIDLDSVKLDRRDRAAMAVVLEALRDTTRETIDRLGAETVAGIVEKHCGGGSRRAGLMSLGAFGQAHAQIKIWHDRIADNPALDAEAGAMEILMELFQREGERMASEIGGEFLPVEIEIERNIAGRDACDICTMSVLHDLACEGLEAIE